MKDRAKQLEELERHFETDNESPDEGDTISKAHDQQEAEEQFSTVSPEPKPKKWKFSKCHDELKDLVPISHAMPIVPSTTVKLSETRVFCQYYSSCTKSEGQSIYRCLLKKKPGSSVNYTYYATQMATMSTYIHQKHLKLCNKLQIVQEKVI